MSRAKKGKIRKVMKDDDGSGIGSGFHAGKARPVDDDGDASEKGKKPRKMWTKEETQMLVDGCNIWGVGNWKAILNDPKFEFQDRSPVDLKDRCVFSLSECCIITHIRLQLSNILP
jgi:hypothetical protein